MKKILIVLLAVTMLFAFVAAKDNRECIVICSCMEQFRNDELQKQLSENFPQKNIVVTYIPTGKAASKIYSEKENSDIDIVIDLESGYLSRIETNLSNACEKSRIPYTDDFSCNEYYNIWSKQAGAIVVNNDVLKKYGLKAPESYKDLLKPEYKNLIAMPDPKSSGTGYFFYKSWVNSMGENEALEYVDKLYANLKQFTESGSGPIKMLKQGEAAIGLCLTFQAVNEINKGQPFEIIFDETGSPYSLTGTALLKGREKNKDIMEVYDFIINDFMVYDKEYFSPETVYKGQINRIENYPQNIKYADMEGIQDYEEKERLLSLWKY